MPHKHTRRKLGEGEKSSFNLPPSEVAKPLPTSKSANANGIFTTELTVSRKSHKRKRKSDADDANHVPQAFRRLMAFRDGKKLPKALDDGVKRTKKQKRDAAQAKEATASNPTKAAEAPKIEVPKIRPGERMSEFSVRVDAALPVSGLINKSARGGKDPLGLKVQRTKKEKKMHKLYDEWREQDRKIKEKKEEALELAEAEAEEEEEVLGVKWKVDMEEEAASNKAKKKKKEKRKKMIGEIADAADDDDPWAVLKAKRGEARVGLHDVVQAPPTLKAVPKEVFKVRGARVNVENVPKTAGSLRKREELGEFRASVVEGYRKLREQKAAARARGV